MDGHIKRSRAPRLLASIALSGAALATLAYLETTSARAETLLNPEPAPQVQRARHDQPHELGATRKQAPAAEAAPAAEVTKLVAKAQAAAAQAELAPAPVAAALVAPDLTGKRLSLARREARKLGIKIVARDEYGERIYPSEAQYYKVRKQKTPAGAAIEPGATIEVRARSFGGYAEGY